MNFNASFAEAHALTGSRDCSKSSPALSRRTPEASCYPTNARVAGNLRASFRYLRDADKKSVDNIFCRVYICLARVKAKCAREEE